MADQEHVPYPRPNPPEVEVERTIPSPYDGQTLKPRQHAILSAYWFATNFHWGALLVIMLPGQIARMNPEFKAQTIGILTGFSALIALFVPLIVGAISDRCTSKWGRRRPFILAGAIFNVIGLACMAAAFAATPQVGGAPGAWAAIVSSPGLMAFFAGYLVVQFGNNVASAAYMGVIPDLVPPDQRGVASGWMALMSQGGTLLGAIGCGLLLGGASDSLKYLLISVVLMGIVLLTIFSMKETPLPYKPSRMEWGPYLRSLWIDPRKHPDFAWVWITRALVMMGFYAIQPFVNYYLVDVIKIPQDKVEGRAAILLGVILLFSTVSGYVGGLLSDKFGRKRVVYWANSLLAISALGFIFCRTELQAVLVGVFFGLFYGAYISVDYALGTDVLPSKDHAGKEMAVWHIAMTLPQSIAAPVAAELISSFGKRQSVVNGETIVNYSVNGYAAIFVLCAFFFALGAFLLRNVKGVR
ncbi:MFS transporter [bacterium]|nr:MAG: MFS transporter [bacterium]